MITTLALRIAASMLHCNLDTPPDIGFINPKLIKEIDAIDQMVKQAGGVLLSRQSIAQIIHQWKKEYPNEKPYGIENNYTES